MVRVGIVGFGFMGKMHFRCYQALENATVVAICDIDGGKFDDTGGAAGNIEGAEQPLNLAGIELHTDFNNMLAKVKLDAISITVPTYMHRDFTVEALNAGMNVLCEKPMALNLDDCEHMVAAAEKSGKILQIGHCIRFWPEYAKTKKLIDSAKYGKVKAASFRRLSLVPTWSWDNWLLEGAQSGGALHDLHVHDSDFVQYVFGMPKAVRAYATKGPSGEFDHVVTSYIYDDEKVIAAEGGWIMTPTFGFEMSFNIILEKATVVFDCTREPAFKLCPLEGQPITPNLQAGDGYSLEIAHFVKAVSGQKVHEVITPAQSLDSVRLALAEKQSAQSRKEITIQ